MRKTDRIYEELMVLRAQAGDETAWTRLVEARHPKMLAHAHRLLRDREAAQDAVQAAWLDILRGLKNLREPGAFRAWSLRIVSRKAAQAVGRAIKDREIAALSDDDGVADEAGPGAADAAALRQAIAALPPAKAATVALFYLEDLRVAEVAVALDVPPGTVKTRLMHARAALAAALKGESDDRQT